MIVADQALTQDIVRPGASFDTFLVAVWKEACKHAEIGESTERIAAILARQMPLAQLVVRRIECKRGCLEAGKQLKNGDPLTLA
jgi:hypothetical protein